MMDCEEAIQDALNQAGTEATGHCLQRFDTDGSPIEVAGTKLTSKGQISKSYQTPYGLAEVERHVYQSSQGGSTYCPMDYSARIFNSTTPRFARICSFKYAHMNSSTVQQDLAESHRRQVSRCYLQDIAEAVGLVAQQKSEHWTYAEPQFEQEVARVAVSLDGTCIQYVEEGWRNAMVGTISFYDLMGERLYTVYLAAAPEYGKATFLARMEREIQVYKKRYGSARWVGIADGAKDYWPWLKQFVDEEVLDYFHAAGYLEQAAAGVCRRRADRLAWFERSRHRLKEEQGAAGELLDEMKQALDRDSVRGEARQRLEKAIGYFENNLERMNYAYCQRHCLPIGSGVTEAACKTVVKQRMCGSGMKWKELGASTVLNLRALVLSKGRWDQFWSKVVRFGI